MPLTKKPANPGVHKPPDEQDTAKFTYEWRRQFPTLAAARNDPKAFWIASDFAGDPLCCSKKTFTPATWQPGACRTSSGAGATALASSATRPSCRALVRELAVALIINHHLKAPNLAKKKVAPLAGLDAIAKRLNPQAPAITGYTGVEPRFVGPKPRKLNGWV